MALLWSSAVVAQDAFTTNFTAGVRLGENASTDAEFAAALRALEAAANAIDELPEQRRDQARFFVGVRRAEVLLRGGEGSRAREVAIATREAARVTPDAGGQAVYGGYYRVLLLVLLWQSTSEEEFFSLLEGDEHDFVFADATLAEVVSRQPSLYVPLIMLRCESELRSGDDAAALQRLSDLADEVRARDDVPAEWRRSCIERLAWYHLTRLDLARAEVQLATLGPDEAPALRALLAYRQGDLAQAEQRARDLVAREPAWRWLLGEILEERGDYGPALTEYRAALAATAEEDEVGRAVLLNNIGDVHFARGELSEAGEAYEAAVAVLDAGKDPLLAAERGQMLMDLGRLAEARGDRTGALDDFEVALQATEDWRRAIPIDPLGSSWLQSYHVGPAIDGILRTSEDPWVGLAATEFGKARGLLDWLDRPPAADGIDELRAAVRRLASSTDAREVGRRRLALERARNLALQAGVRSVEPLGPHDLPGLLAGFPDVVFVSYWIGERRASALVGRAGDLRLVDLGEREPALAALRAAYRAVADPGGDPWPALDAAGALFWPAEVGDAQRVVVIVDALTERLPVEALRVDGRPLGTRLEIERAPSLSVFARLDRRVRKGNRVVVLDDVATPDATAARLGLSPLQFSRREGDAVAGCYDVPVTRLFGEGATFEALDAALRSDPAGVVHLSTHAIASPLVPSRSLLLLAGGPVSMASLAHLSLDGAVVVLSACSTATGESRGGEGVAGLLWGPMAAGARGVVASLWPVNQEATGVLMGEFHAARAQGLGDAAAMRVARTRLAGDRRYGHPHYWAGFAVHGGATENPILARPEAPWWVWAGFLVMFGLVVLWWLDKLRGGLRINPRADRRTTT